MITCVVNTKDRYFTTLPLTLSAIAQQTLKPSKLIIFDDGEQKDLRQVPLYQRIFDLLTMCNVEWSVVFGQRKGQVANHQAALLNESNPYIWRLDDDNIPDKECLQRLFGTFHKDADKTGAVGGLVLHPPNPMKACALINNHLDQLHLMRNTQWYAHPAGLVLPVEHLYSTFLYSRKAALSIGGYEMGLSPVGHCEETILTSKMHRAGYLLKVCTSAVTYHLRNAEGGIRTQTDRGMWKHDEEIFHKLIESWGVKKKTYLPIFLKGGLGDHLILKGVLGDIRDTHLDKEIVICATFPEVFKDASLCVIDLDNAVEIFGKEIRELDVYGWMINNHWTGHIKDAYLKIYANKDSHFSL